MNAARYGAAIMGAGPAGEVAASRLNAQGVKVTLVERELAGEWIHYAALAIKTKTPISVLHDTVAQFPTFTEVPEGGREP